MGCGLSGSTTLRRFSCPTNARTTFYARLLMVERFEAGWAKAHTPAMGSRVVCAHLDQPIPGRGEAGLVERSSRPHTTPTRTPRTVENQIVDWRRADADLMRSGPSSGCAPCTVSRVLSRRGVSPAGLRSDDRGADPASKSTAVRLTSGPTRRAGAHGRQETGSHPRRGGWRIHGRHNRARDRKAQLGFDYVHSVVDDHSRAGLQRNPADEEGPTCAAFLRRATEYFASHGIAVIESKSMTDNAWAYRYSLRALCAELHIDQIFIKAHCPGRTARSNDSTAPCKPNGPTGSPSPPTPNAAALAPWIEALQH